MNKEKIEGTLESFGSRTKQNKILKKDKYIKNFQTP